MSSVRGMRMPFGAYRGVAVASLTDVYLRWLSRRADLDASLRAAVHEECARRGIDRAGDWLRRQQKGEAR